VRRIPCGIAPPIRRLSSRRNESEARGAGSGRFEATSSWRRLVSIRILVDAEDEIESARRYLTQQASRLGDRFLDDLDETLDAIVERPESFSRLETLPDDAPYRRALLSIFRYAVIFEIVSDEILVVALAHTSREPNYWLDRLA
jgi:plasmid stabilization system protein ParE